AAMRPLLKSSSTMLLSRSLTSDSGNVRSTRASPSTSPLREKYPTPLLNSTTRVIGRLTAGFRSCFASPAANSLSAPSPAPMPSAPATGATISHLLAIGRPPPGAPVWGGQVGSYPGGAAGVTGTFARGHGCYDSPNSTRSTQTPSISGSPVRQESSRSGL